MILVKILEFFDFLIFRPLGGRSKGSNLLTIMNYFWLFDFSTSCWEAKMIDFTENIGFFRIFGILLGGQLSDFTGYFGFFRLFDFSSSCREVKMIDFTVYIWFFRLFDILVGGQNNWFYWIYCFFWLFDFSISWWEV